MRYLFFILLSFLVTINPVFAENVRFVQVTDVHTTQDNVKYLEDFVQNINKLPNIDFVVFTGDNIDTPNEKDLVSFLDAIKQIKVKTYITLGNHDVSKYQHLDKKLYMDTVKSKLGNYHSDKPNYVFKDKDIVFVVMDGVKEVIPGSCAYFKEEELVWLDKTLSKYKNNKIVILQHFPLLKTRATNHSIYKEEDYLNILKKHNNVIAVVSGHYHYNVEEKQYGVYNIVTAKFSEKENYKIIEIDNNSNMIFTQLNSAKDFEI